MGALSSRSKSVRQWCCDNERVALLVRDRENADDEDGEDQRSVIQFASAEFYATEDEGFAHVEIVRFGDCSGAAQVTYRTVDVSAKAGSEYLHMEGVMFFQPQECLKTFEVPLSRDDFWKSALEFKVVLSRARQARLGNYLKVCTVHVLDDDCFPTNRYRAEVRDMDSIFEISGPGLFLEYIRLCLAQEAMGTATFKFLAMEQIENVYFVLTLYLEVYLVDTVLRILPPEEQVGPMSKLIVPHRETTAIIVALMYVAPFGAVHLFEQLKMSLGIAGMGRKFLQASLLRRFLNYPEEIRNQVSAGEVVMAMTRDVTQVVKMYMDALALLGGFGKSLLTLIFILNKNEMAALPLSVFPLIMGLFLLFRSRSMAETTHLVSDAQDDLVAAVNEAVENYRMISDFKLRHYTVDCYMEKNVQFGKVAGALGTEMLNTAYLPPWLMTILIGLYIVYGVFQVRNLGGTISLGTYLATMSAFKDMGLQIGAMFMEFAQILKCFGPLKRLTFYLNQPSNLMRRMVLNRARWKQGREIYVGKLGSSIGTDSRGLAVWGVDTVPLAFAKVKFAYGAANSKQHNVFHGISRSFPQGRLYGFIGERHCGKSTLLKLLGQVLVPAEDCQIFVPPHLRILHVSRETKVTNQPLLNNITFDQSIESVGGMERVRFICEATGFQPKLLDELEQNEHIAGVAQQRWVDYLSLTDYARLSLVRALVRNPECLVMHMPFQAFTAAEGLRQMALLRQHVRERGLGFPHESRRHRRVRTAFVTLSHKDLCREADNVYEVTPADGLIPVALDRKSRK